MHHIYDGSMETEDEERVQVAMPTDRRPDFVAEAMSPLMRVGILCGALFACAMVIFVVSAQAIWPEGLFSVSPFVAVFSIGMLIATGFFMLLVFGAILGNNPNITKTARGIWYASFILLGPFVLPLYWLMYVWPTPYVPSPYQKT